MENNEFKKRIQSAVEKYAKKEDPAREHKKNKSPERDLQKEIIKWLNSIGWSVANIDSKSTYSVAQGRYLSQSAQVGTSDIVGNDPNGRAAYIEVKAPGKRNTIRHKQYDFLIEKINSNCFAIVADSKEYIQKIYEEFNKSFEKRTLLIKELPIPKSQDNSSELFL